MWALPIVLMIYALIDCAQDDQADRTGLPKPLWMVLIILLPAVGAIAWITLSKIAKPKPRPTPRRPARPIAPDDDPDFLRRLAEEQRRRQQGKQGKGNPEDSDK
jgi:hypothetical protein